MLLDTWYENKEYLSEQEVESRYGEYIQQEILPRLQIVEKRNDLSNTTLSVLKRYSKLVGIRLDKKRIQKDNVRSMKYCILSKPAMLTEEKCRHGFVYILKGPFDCYKIGKTININKRLNNIKLPFDIELLFYVRVEDYSKTEALFHKLYAPYKTNGEWFSLTDTQVKNLIIKLQAYEVKN